MPTDPFIGEITMYAFPFPPQGWAQCNGQTLSIAQYNAVFALLSTQYGGNGHTTFNLPNLQGRSPMHVGQGAGLTPRTMGEMGGTESVTLTTETMPIHSHNATVTSILHGETALANLRNPLNNMLATPPAGAQIYAEPVPAEDKPMAPESIVSTAVIDNAGGSQPFGIMSPYQVVNFCIALVGIFPTRN